MFPDKSSNRVLQQQRPTDHGSRQQQQSGSTEFQPKPGAQQQMGEGSYEATRDYQKNIENYMEKADIASDAEKAKPRSEAEKRELEDAEREGRSHSKGER